MERFGSKRVVTALLAFIAAVIVLALVWTRPEPPQPRRVAPVRPPQQSEPQLAPGEVDALPPVTVQFTATALRGPAYSDAPHERIEIMQGEHWLREQRTEGETVIVTFQRLHSNTWMTWGRTADGADLALSASSETRPAGHRGVTEMFYRNTERTDVALGERCTIWEGDYARADMRRPSSRWTTCITNDGIRLWSRGRDFEGRERVTSRLLNLRRRLIATEEIAPPGRLFRWSTWRGETERAPAHNLSIDLASPSNEAQRDDSETVRERGEWRYLHSVDGDRQRRWIITSPSVQFSYSESNFHWPTRNLVISRTPRQPVRAADEPLLQPPRIETIVGLRCRWFDTPAPSHSTSAACRTDDNLTLAHWFQGDGVRGGDTHFSVRATRLSRELLPASALAPPPQAFEWRS